MHSGHRLLLTQAALLTTDRMLVGVTSDSLLSKKSYANIIESYETRCNHVRSFIKRLCGSSGPELDIFELNDPAGKAATDPEIEACILTPEVKKGGDMINQKREENGLPRVKLVFADMILAQESESEQEKINFSNKTSSTKIREYIQKHKEEGK